jgi:hypothetical protein
MEKDMAQDDNRRRYTRLTCKVPATLEYAGTGFDANLVDVSLDGVAMSTGALVDTEQPVAVRFDPVARGQMTVEAHGSVIRNDNGRVAVQITDIDQLSTQRLTAWLEANHPDPDQARKEVQRIIARQALDGPTPGDKSDEPRPESEPKSRATAPTPAETSAAGSDESAGQAKAQAPAAAEGKTRKTARKTRKSTRKKAGSRSGAKSAESSTDKAETSAKAKSAAKAKPGTRKKTGSGTARKKKTAESPSAGKTRKTAAGKSKAAARRKSAKSAAKTSKQATDDID